MKQNVFHAGECFYAFTVVKFSCHVLGRLSQMIILMRKRRKVPFSTKDAVPLCTSSHFSYSRTDVKTGIPGTEVEIICQDLYSIAQGEIWVHLFL